VTIAILVFVAGVGAIAAWWLWQQGITTKPWLEQGPIDLPATGGSPMPAAKIGLGVFLAVVSSLFALFISAYSMRMHMGDWTHLRAPSLLWFNTGVLVLSSITIQAAQVAARRGQTDRIRTSLLAAGASTVAFLVGQLLAWKQLAAAGYFMTNSPAAAFFYVLTAVHGLHLLGGLVALGRTMEKVWHGADADQMRLSVELCAIYWHFLLLVWLLLFGVLLLS
jgi:cytochrome c oxidase subunit 3